MNCQRLRCHSFLAVPFLRTRHSYSTARLLLRSPARSLFVQLTARLQFYLCASTQATFSLVVFIRSPFASAFIRS